MAAVNVVVPHRLTEDEVLQRLKCRLATVKTEFAAHLKDFQEAWTDHTLDCGFSTFGMKIRSKVAVAAGAVNVTAELPMMAGMFKGQIEQKIREELGKLLG